MVVCLGVKSCDVDTSGFVSKFYGAFNSTMHVVRYKRNEMVAVQLVGSYCLPSMLYGCEVWQTRADDVRSASVAWNNCFRKIFTARCTLVQSAVLRSHGVCLSVCPSVCNVGGL